VKFLLDTDHISILQRQAGPEFAALSIRLAQQQLSDLAFCVVSFHEQVLGCHTYLNRARTSADVVRGYQMLDRVLDAFAAAQVLPFDAGAAAVFDGLLTQRVRLAVMDLRIASIALSRGLVLLTRNLRDFGRVPGLLTEDWTL
jgi:tRNA(fMet)-specific endonuclease VapC